MDIPDAPVLRAGMFRYFSDLECESLDERVLGFGEAKMQSEITGLCSSQGSDLLMDIDWCLLVG